MNAVRNLLRAAVVGASLLTSAQFAAAQNYPLPSQPVKLIVSAQVGSSVDATARLVAEQIRKRTGANFIVENKAGANGIPALGEVARAAPDGYTLLIGNINTNGLAPAIHAKKYDFDVKSGLQPVTMLSDGPSALIAWKTAAKTYPEALAQWRANPGKWSYFGAGVGAFTHIWFAKLSQREKVNLLFVPVKGGAQGTQLMGAGQVHYSYVPITSFIGQMRSGDVRALFVTGPQRLSEFPDVPTAREVGLPEDFEINTWVGLFAPAGMRPDLLRRVHALFSEAARSPDLAQQYRSLYMQQLVSASPEEFKKWVDARIDNYKSVAEIAGIKPED